MKDIYIGKVAGQLNSVYILSTMDSNLKLNLKKEFRVLVYDSKYELLMKQKNTVTSVYLEGEMTLKDIQNIMLYQNTRLNGNVYHIPGIELADTKVWKRLI